MGCRVVWRGLVIPDLAIRAADYEGTSPRTSRTQTHAQESAKKVSGITLEYRGRYRRLVGGDCIIVVYPVAHRIVFIIRVVELI